MQNRYIEITAGSPNALGLHGSAEGAKLLAGHHHPSDTDAIETAIKRAAAEMSAVLPEVQIGTDLWKATIWEAKFYDATHPASERQAAHLEEMRRLYT